MEKIDRLVDRQTDRLTLSALLDKYFIISFLISLVVILSTIIYGGQNFSIDSYGILVDGNEHFTNFIGAYRFFGALIIKIYTLLGHNPILNSNLDVIIYIIIVSLSLSLFVRFSALVFHELFREKIILLTVVFFEAGCLLTVTNCWYTDILTFPECILLSAFGMSFCLFSIMFFVAGLIEKNKKFIHYFSSGILLICSTAVYQQFITVFFIWSIVFTNTKIVSSVEHKFKRLINEYLPCIIVTILSGVLYFIIGKVVSVILNISPNSRIALNISQIIENVKYFISHQHSFLKGRGYFESEFLTVSFLAFGFVWLLCLALDYRNNINPIRTFVLVTANAAAYVSVYLLGLISTSHATRTMFGLFSVFPLLAIGCISLKNKTWLKCVLSIALAVLVSVGIFKGAKAEMRQKNINKNDALYVSSIVEKIEKYQESHDDSITSISFIYDSEQNINEGSYIYTNYAFRNMLVLALNEKSWPKITVLEEKDNDILEKYKYINYDSFDLNKQVLIDGDKALIIVY